MRLGMAINLTRCVGCQTCEAVCKLENGVPKDFYFSRTIDHEVGEYPDVERELFPVICMHCENASCIDVCPLDAIERTEEGIVQIDADKCRGCESCIDACPYGAMNFFEGDVEYYEVGGGESPIKERIREEHSKEGIATKCDFCIERVREGMENGLTPGEDQEATPFCVIACPTEGRTFGDLDDPESEVSKTIKQKDGFQLQPYEGADPSVFYISQRSKEPKDGGNG
ncbi:hypothetical protein AKJ66_00955 [candidate division MSBL1 archaeon SCGC-AAA259E22]|uniref:4Fe-4S ferredoxin-type domain-containing protein n=1 Tax=candidate division MSBL1 archaeon SCGC-AAA259E22 TaxID=1698265 RepID=A0A133UHV2_9EURY|nr:hypothetical protein AKJ66_00955 [candidate division MSBL1 archaeon SCGC-AAA259E22]